MPGQQYRDAERAFRRILPAGNITLLGLDFATRSLSPKCQEPKLYCADDVCVVGINRGLIQELETRYQFKLRPDDALNGSVKQNNQSIQAWIGRTAIPLPEPTYEEIALDAADSSTSVLFAEFALSRANEVSHLAQDSADRFPDFLRESVSALGRLGGLTAGLAGQDLTQFFAETAPLAVYAPTGEETVQYLDPFSGLAHTTAKHLKPRTERKGFMNPALKPRLFFDIVKESKPRDGKFAVVLYFGPHLKKGRPLNVGRVLRREQTAAATGTEN